MKIEIKSITLQNFKKERYKTLSFAHNVLISGGNETGKTTIYDAYLWCLFGVTSRPDTIVQTLDCNNNIIHKLETSVVVVINYNDERDIKIERRLAERWKGKDTADEKFMGTTQSRLVDDVPYSVSQFKEKLNSLCNFEDWFMLSNISLFWTYKVSKCSNVTIAAFNNNKLTRADLANCIMLQSLWLNDNKLSSVIPPKKMPFLNVLNIANNEFESFDFNLASSASEIVANNNKLSGTVDLSKCYVLEKFFGSDNNIEKIEFSGSDLTTLIVNNNKLKVLDPKSSSIYWLEAKNNEITGVNVSYGDNLYLAHLDNNKLNSLNLNENNKIVSLSLRNNLFEDNALERIYEQLPVLDDFTPAPEYSGWMKWLFVEGNPGAKTADATIATDKGWLVDVVTPTGIEKMDTDNSGLLFDKTSGKLLLNGTIVTSGRIVSMDGTSRSFDSNNGDFNINNLPHGVYVIRVVADGKTYTKKILK